MIDNAVLHAFPHSPWIAKCAVNVRQGKKIVLRAVLRDEKAARAWLARVFPDINCKLIIHN